MNINEIKALVRLNLMPSYLPYGWAKHRFDQARKAKDDPSSESATWEDYDPISKLPDYTLGKWIVRGMTIVVGFFFAITMSLVVSKYIHNVAAAWGVYAGALVILVSLVVGILLPTRDSQSPLGLFGRDVEELSDALDIEIKVLLTAVEEERNSLIGQRLMALRNSLLAEEREKGIRHPDTETPRKAFHRGWAIAMEFSMADDYGKDFQPVSPPQGPVISWTIGAEGSGS